MRSEIYISPVEACGDLRVQKYKRVYSPTLFIPINHV